MSKDNKKKEGKVFGKSKKDFIFPQQWKIDIDYWHDLDKDSDAYLRKFNKEWVAGVFGENPIHLTRKQRRECYTNSDATRRDIMSRNTTKELGTIADHIRFKILGNETENGLIEVLDAVAKKQRIENRLKRLKEREERISDRRKRR